MGADAVAPFVLILIFNPDKNKPFCSNGIHPMLSTTAPFSLLLSPLVGKLQWILAVFFSLQFLLFVDVKFSFHSTEFICTFIHLKCYKCEINSGYKWICVGIFKFRHLQHDHRIENTCSTHSKCMSHTIFPLRWLRNNNFDNEMNRIMMSTRWGCTIVWAMCIVHRDRMNNFIQIVLFLLFHSMRDTTRGVRCGTRQKKKMFKLRTFNDRKKATTCKRVGSSNRMSEDEKQPQKSREKKNINYVNSEEWMLPTI